jgi:hypothetical protein
LAGTDTDTLKRRIEEQGFDAVQKQIVDLDKIESDSAKRFCKERGWNYEALKEVEHQEELRKTRDAATVKRLSQPAVVQRPPGPPASELMIASAIRTSTALSKKS